MYQNCDELATRVHRWTLFKRVRANRNIRTIAGSGTRGIWPEFAILLWAILAGCGGCQPDGVGAGGDCEQTRDCATGLWCLGRICQENPVQFEGGKDARPGERHDAGGLDAEADGFWDSGPDPGPDEDKPDGSDSGNDMGPADAEAEGGVDSGIDAEFDAGTDAGTDIGSGYFCTFDGGLVNDAGICSSPCPGGTSCLKGRCALPACADPDIFPSLPPIPTGHIPGAVVIADLDDNGVADLAVANRDDNTVSVILHRGHGEIDEQVTYPVGHAPLSLVAADLNRDGHLDLVVANAGDNAVGVLMGLGGGVFAAHIAYDVGDSPQAVAVGDLNNDGWPDIASANIGWVGSVSVLFGRGDGQFSSQTRYNVSDATSIAIGDLNNDGAADIAIVRTEASQAAWGVFMNNGDGTFGPFEVHEASGLGDLVITDFNNDGLGDVLTPWRVHLNNGDGTFGSQLLNLGGQDTISSLRHLTVSDLNGDGWKDIAGDGGPLRYDRDYSGVAVLLNEKNGTFGKASVFRTVKESAGIASGDFDGDGDVDLVVTDEMADTVQVLLNPGRGRFNNGPIFGVEGDYEGGIVAADFNDDGALDLATAYGHGGMATVLLNNGDGTFGKPVSWSSGRDPEMIAAADFNRDGLVDIVTVSGYAGEVAIIFNLGAGLFSKAATYDLAIRHGSVSLAIADFNCDGAPDIIVPTEGESPLVILFNDGTGAFLLREIVGTLSHFSAVGAADFNGDGTPDVVAAGVEGLEVFVSMSNGAFVSKGTYGTNPPTMGRHSLAVGDVDGNDAPDIVQVSDDGKVRVYLNDKTGKLDGPSVYEPGGKFSFISLADMDNNGTADVVITDDAHNTVMILQNDGSGKLNSPMIYPAGVLPRGVATADFDADGRIDLAVVDYGTPSAAVWMLFNSCISP